MAGGRFDWTDERVAAIRAGVVDGKTGKEVADEIGARTVG